MAKTRPIAQIIKRMARGVEETILTLMAKVASSRSNSLRKEALQTRRRGTVRTKLRNKIMLLRTRNLETLPTKTRAKTTLSHATITTPITQVSINQLATNIPFPI